MKRKRLKRYFFERDTRIVAKDLLGKYLCGKIGKKVICGRILETEAYRGEYDLACHACHGRTKRTEIMYGRAGCAYIYLCYGMHWMLNIVTEKENFPAAVLIRALQVETGAAQKNKINLSGPGKLTKFLQISGKFNGEDLINSKKLWVEDRGEIVKNSDIKKGPRIGVSYAKHCAKWKWNFKIKV